MRRVEVQRCPAVPRAPNTIARVARSRFASSVMMIALLPPSSRMVPESPGYGFGNVLSDGVEPVKEISANRLSPTFDPRCCHRGRLQG